MLRGIDKQEIFEDTGDNLKMLYILHDCAGMGGVQLLAYCLMGNHIHLLLKVPHETPEALERVMKYIGMRYVVYFNQKNQRLGGLFQGRYKSEPVEDKAYLLRVVRYIHNNPVKAGICQNAGEYAYSSYQDYFDGRSGICPVNTNYVLSLVESPEWFCRYHARPDCSKAFLDYTEYRPPLTDAQIKVAMSNACGCQTVETFQTMPTKEQARTLDALKEQGAKVPQLSRLTGISVGRIYRLLRELNQ
jgi:REP element-mobilizing transposase RayT